MTTSAKKTEIKTLADLKRLPVGTKITMIYPTTNRLCGIEREVLSANTTGISIKTGEKKSFFEYPKATLFEATKDGFRTYKAGLRDLTAEEKRIMDNRPQDAKQAEIDIMTDSSVMFRREQLYYKQSGFEYLNGHDEQKGMRFCFNTRKIIDRNIKGDIDLEYTIN